MAGIMTAMSTAGAIFNAVAKADSNDKTAIANAIKAALTGKEAALIRTDGSITKLLSKFIVEPVVIATANTRSTDVIDKILEVNTDIFASFYTQAFEILTSYYKQNVITTIDVLGTDNGGAFRAAIGAYGNFSTEDAKIEKDYLYELFNSNSLGLESNSSTTGTDKASSNSGNSYNMYTKKPDENSSSVHKSETNSFKLGANFKDQPTSIVLQRNIELTISKEKDTTSMSDSSSGGISSSSNGKHSEKHTIVIPITIKTHVIFVDTKDLLNMLAPNSSTKSFGYRLDEYRSGAISLADLIFAGDLILQYKQNKLNDQHDLLGLINSRTLSANSKLMDKNIIGFEKSYNMLVITAEDKVLLDKHLNGNLDSEKYKQKLLTEANAMTVTVIDQDFERIYILTRDIRGRTDISFKTLNKRKDSGADLTEVMKALISGRPPVF